ncbi:hypothetical protein TanjilG_13379 [Lupinus angustifolius]|uniref:Ubiquitin carboxyl-terminal hydrolase n=1 Tax=Lupinus angustifolius TaxID=3871 RepID=A0A4P1RVF0_LUPAN|nr:PREDICTED: ubiquitin carboxyl-terminal hydrolase 23-like isoform X2 [Lupinus angustifolius]OIW18627.1 hypothetical protein TanjilG_13379 [Lupinus angustifolius]
MAESVLIQTETQINSSDPSSSISVLLHRKIEFLPAKKPFKGFSNDFHIETLNPTTTSETTLTLSASVKKNDGSEFSEFGLDPDLCFGITVRKIGAGLRNLGNTCFLNSVIQCLTYTEPLAAYLQSGKHKSSCRIAGFCALCAIQNHVSRALQSTGRILSPEHLVGNLRCISRNFRNARQEDAHEYMVNLLESMHKCCLPSGIPSESNGAYEKSLVHKIFGGRLRSQVKCQQCNFSSNKFDPFLDLSLEIFKADSLQKALANFTAAELLDGGDRQYQCQKCKQKVRALKQLTIHKAPYVLTIHLKRFFAHDPGLKIKKKVNFGCALDLKPFVSGSYDGDVKYSLYGVLVHSGSSTHSGHYYCYVRTSNNMWYTLDDNRVSHVSEREVLNQQAYMLFYVRDRKSIVPRKPVDIAKKENMKVNVNLNVNANRDSSTSHHELKAVTNGPVDNKSCLTPVAQKKLPNGPLNENANKDSSNQVFKGVTNGPVENKSSSESCLIAEPPKNTSNVDSSRVPCIKDSVVQQKSNLILAESLVNSKKLVSEPSSQLQLKKGSSEGSYVANEGSNVSDQNKISKEGSKNSFSTVLINNPQTSTDKQISDITSKTQKVGASAPGSVYNETGSKVCEGAVGCQELVLHESANRLLNMENHNEKQLKKSKKKFLKYNISSMYFRSTYLFLAHLGPRKKNLKRSKCRRLGLKNPNIEKLDKHALSSDVGPSTPGKAEVFPSVSNSFEHSTTKAGDTPDAKFKLNDKSLLETTIAGGEFRKRTEMNCAVLATAVQVENISGGDSGLNQFEARQADSLQDCKRDQMLNTSISMPARSLEETVVATWDDRELPQSHALDSSNVKTATIGYVGDEWDEDYDKGKRKKLRGIKQSFGGPNLFQEIASEKSRSKRAKLDRSNSGNAPFRI